MLSWLIRILEAKNSVYYVNIKGRHRHTHTHTHRILDSENCQTVHLSARIIAVIEPRGTRWLERRARVGDGEFLHDFSRHPWIEETTWGAYAEMGLYFEGAFHGNRICRVLTAFIWLSILTVSRLMWIQCEPSNSIKGRDIVEQLSKY